MNFTKKKCFLLSAAGTGRSTRQIRNARVSNQSTNGVSSSHNEPGPSGYSIRQTARKHVTTHRMRSDNDDDEEELTEQSSDSSDSDSDESENYNPNEPKSYKSKKKNRKVNGTIQKRGRRLVLEDDDDDEAVDVETTVQNGKQIIVIDILIIFI